MSRAAVPGLPSRHPIGEQLPALYADDDFAQRFTAGLDTVLAPVFTTLDNLPSYFDPRLAPADFLSWLASWVGGADDPDWPTALRREAVARAVELHRWRGTRRGLTEALRLVLGVSAEVSGDGTATWSRTAGAEPLPPRPARSWYGCGRAARERRTRWTGSARSSAPCARFIRSAGWRSCPGRPQVKGADGIACVSRVRCVQRRDGRLLRQLRRLPGLVGLHPRAGCGRDDPEHRPGCPSCGCGRRGSRTGGLPAARCRGGRPARPLGSGAGPARARRRTVRAVRALRPVHAVRPARALGGSPSPSEPDPPRTPLPTARAAGGEDRTRPGTAPAARPPAVPQAAVPEAVAPEAVAPQASASPQPVRPAKAVAPRPVVRAPVVSDDVAGVPCPSCGTPNPSDRRFCRRCAAPLTSGAAPAPLPWWRTIWPLRRRTRAGSGRMVRFLVILAVVLALCAAGFLMLPAGRHLIEDTRDKLGKAKAVTPTRVEASAELPGHPVSHSTDGLSNRYWGVPGPGASATYTFAKPFRLVDVIITNGASSSPEEYANQGRALQIDMEVTAQDGQKVRKQLTLSDKPGPQTFPTGISDVTAIRLTLDAPAGSAPDRHVALAEVEFFQRS